MNGQKVLDYAEPHSEPGAGWMVRLVLGLVLSFPPAVTGFLVCMDAAYRFELFFEYGAVLEKNHIPDFGFAARYKLAAAGAAMALAAAIIIWRRWWSWLAGAITLANLLALLGFFLMHRSLMLVEYSETRVFGP
jgi:hypothetical protein